jgi:hypothetical protein
VQRQVKDKIMSGKNNVATLHQPPGLAPGGEPASKQSSAEHHALEDHRTIMSRGELIFYLRDVHPYWSTPRISHHEIEKLEQQNLIQRNTTDICAIRLTEHGAAVKNWQQLKGP